LFVFGSSHWSPLFMIPSPQNGAVVVVVVEVVVVDVVVVVSGGSGGSGRPPPQLTQPSISSLAKVFFRKIVVTKRAAIIRIKAILRSILLYLIYFFDLPRKWDEQRVSQHS